MSICQVVNDIDLFFTRPYDLTPEENAEKNRQELLNTVRKTKKDFEKKSFIIEFGIPHEDSEKVHSLLEKAEIFLESNEDTMFLTLIEELKVSLTNLRDYGKARLDNIT